MIDQNDIMCHVRESFSGLRMDVPVETLFARSRLRRPRRRLSVLTTTAAATAGAAAAMALTAGGPAPALGAHAPARSDSRPAASPGQAELAAFSVTSGPGGSTTLTLHNGPRYQPLDASAVNRALLAHGVPALVTYGTLCRSTPPGSGDFGQILQQSNSADGSKVVINDQAIPPGMRLSIGYYQHAVQIALIKVGAPLSCRKPSGHNAVHLTPSGTPIRRSK